VDGYVHVVFDMQQEEPGFRFGFGANAGLGGGCGWDFYCDAGFRNLRRALTRSTLRISTELQTQMRARDIGTPPHLGLALDFSLSLVVLTAYDLGRASYAKGNLLDAQEIIDILADNTVQQFQRFILDRLVDTAIGRMSAAFADLYELLTGISLDDAAKAALRTEIRALTDILDKGRVDYDDIGKIIGHASAIIDIVDGGEFDRFKPPLTLFWCAATLGLEIKGQLDEVFADIGISNSILGSASTQAASALLPPAPAWAVEEVSAALDRTVVSIDTAAAVDYLISQGPDDLIADYAPQFSVLRDRLTEALDLTEGDVVSDLLTVFKGEGSLSGLRSYTAMRAFVKTELLDAMVLGDLIPRMKQELNDPTGVEYLTEVVEPTILTVSEFIFDRLDELLIDDITSPLDVVARQSSIEKLSSGCGEVVYTVLVRNVLFFEKLVSEAALTTSHTQFGQMRTWLEDDNNRFLQDAVTLAHDMLPGHPNVAQNLSAFRILMTDIVTALEFLTGPLVLSEDRRNRLHALKRDLLLPTERVQNFRDGQLIEQAVAEMIACNIPNTDLNKVKDLTRLMYEIGLDSLEIIANQVVPSLADFFLAVTLNDLVNLRTRLLDAIDQTRQSLIAAATALDEATDALREDILEALSAVQEAASALMASITTALSDDWESLATARLQLIGRQKIMAQNLGDAQQSAAIIASDIAIAGATAAAALAVRTLLGDVETKINALLTGGTDAITAFLDLVEDIEDQVLGAFVNVVDWAGEAATIFVDTMLPQSLLDDITDYLTAREQEKALIIARTDAEQAVREAEEAKARKEAQLAKIDHRPGMNVTVIAPRPEFTFVYPASIEITIALSGFTREMLIGQARRVQVRLNGTAITIAAADISTDGNGYIFRRILSEGSLVDGLNLLEVSWITGATSDETTRRTVPFVVDASTFVPRGDFSFAFDYDPPGSDVDHEFVQIGWHGTETLDLSGTTLSDRANHRYALPDVTLTPGAQLRVYTGGNPSSDTVDPAANLQTLHMGRRKAVWNNEGDTLFLTRNGVTLLVTASYTADERGTGP
ncbi:MAG: lamin tail domain-containing protein, partial [Pseudomonadota bacterium]